MSIRAGQQSTLTTFAPLIDGFLVAIGGWIAYFTRWYSWDMSLEYVSVLVLGTSLTIIVLPMSGAYKSWRGETRWQKGGNTIPGLLAVAAILMIAGTLTKTSADFSRLWMGYWLIYSLIALLLFRWLFGALSRYLGFTERQTVRVLMVGAGDYAHTVATKARAATDAHWQITGFVPTGAVKDCIQNDPAPLASLEEMEKLASDPDSAIEEIWIALAEDELGSRESVIQLLQSSCVAVRYIPDLSVLTLLNHVPAEAAGMTVIDLNASPLTGHNILLKAVFDRLFALTALLLLAPVLIIIALCIKLTSVGPVIFRQKRHGSDGSVIHVLKFRTMKSANSTDSSNNGMQQAHKNDPRITPIGHLLRRTSLDELPQFLNVLRGDMSVVGPRPHPLALNEFYISSINAYMQRHRVKPGITGWAQVHGFRGQTDSLEKMQNRVSYDLYYIQHWSLWMDIQIIALTLLRGWTGRNAY
ncbi:MAG: Undecaprenyl-phosphate glucose phosphotransferase [Halioglobus sp.]|jgi:Undecaprenyl-phosphate glucose phosphotransferase